MKKKELYENLKALDKELSRIKTLDESGKKILKDLMTEIEDVLDKFDAESNKNDGLITHISDISRQFESSHPDLTAFLGKMVDSLSNMGI